jgi:pyruvate kinase
VHRRAKIVATLGPASADDRIVGRLLAAGADVFRVNLSHGTAEEHRETVARVRRAAARRAKHVPVILDLMGPRYRLGEMSTPRELEPDQRITLGTDQRAADLPVGDPSLLASLAPGERILIADGLIELEVLEASPREVAARVVNGGRVSSRKGINLPDTQIPFAISEKDHADIRLAVELRADYLAVSYVSTAADLDAVRGAVSDLGGDIPLVAKLERALAIRHLEEIVGASDAVMVARGDLGVEVPLHRVPILQKRIVESGRSHGRPVIVATQMLESMIDKPRPTRAESSDVANAIFDGADALMLSGESAAGHHPVEAVEVMDRIIREAEAYRLEAGGGDDTVMRLAAADLPDEQRAGGHGSVSAFEIADTVAVAAVHAARTLNLGHIVAFSQGGFTARVISRYRPAAPIWMLTTDEAVARRVQLAWGVRPLLLDQDVEHHDEVVARVDCELLEHGLAQPGETIAVLMGDPIRERPLTNLMRIHRIRSRP